MATINNENRTFSTPFVRTPVAGFVPVVNTFVPAQTTIALAQPFVMPTWGYVAIAAGAGFLIAYLILKNRTN